MQLIMEMQNMMLLWAPKGTLTQSTPSIVFIIWAHFHSLKEILIATNYFVYFFFRYYKSGKLNEKSDIYSFGIVLLELITGQPAVLKGKESIHILDWLGPELRKGDLSKIIDPKLQGRYNACSVWKALGAALACTASASIHRPTMSCVLSELKRCLETEVPSQCETYIVPAQIYKELHRLSVAYSLDDESITYPFPR